VATGRRGSPLHSDHEPTYSSAGATALVTPAGITILSVVVAALVSLGATFGGTLVYDYGFNVETATDSPVWHKSETDVLPGHHEEPTSARDESMSA